MKIILLIIEICFIASVTSDVSTAIPDTLLKCYQSNFTEFLPQTPLIPNLLSEIIRKLEFHNNALNLRRLSNSILHTIKFDGVERSDVINYIPYRASGKQFTKYQFIVEHLTPGDSKEFPFDALDDQTLCILHYVISNTIDLLPRGDEKYTCKVDRSNPMENRMNNDDISSCPQEFGVIKTKWGTISPGHIIAGIASALQKDTVALGKLLDSIKRKQPITLSSKSKNILINNMLVSTIAGDLAEVLLNQQTETPKIGSRGFWNSSYLPQKYYIRGNYWDMSEAKMLGSIDGLIISHKINEFFTKFDGIRLSQLIDMYYSDRGIAFDQTYRACERKKNLKLIIKEMNLVDQVSGTAIALQNIGSYKAFLPDNVITNLSKGVVESFQEVVDSLRSDYDKCNNDYNLLTPLEILTIFDHTWNRNEAETFLSYFSEIADVSHYGSKIGVINGNKGIFVANITSDLIQLYKNLSAESVWPSTLSLTKGLHSAIRYYQNSTKSICSNFEQPHGNVLVIISLSTSVSSDEYVGAYDSLKSLKNFRPELRVIIVTAEDNSSKFRQLVRSLNLNGVVLSVDDPKNIENAAENIYKELYDQPASIINFYCNNSQSNFETYITPGFESFYEIHEEYASRANIFVKFKGSHYGDLSICAYSSKSIENKICKGITVGSEVTFNIKDHCSTDSTCTVKFAIAANQSHFMCTEFECRYPDQVRLNINTYWSGGRNILPTFQLILFITIIANYIR